MSEKEKKIIQTIATALPNMSDMDKGYFLGFAEAMASQNKDKNKKGSDKEDK